jgi:hypothetical protein
MPTQQAALSHAQLADDGTPHGERHADIREGGESAGCCLSALRLVPVPETGPPFDGESPADATATAAPADNSTWDGTPRGGLTSGGPPPGVFMYDAPDGGQRRAGASPAGSRAEDEWSRQFALLLTETLAGARPLRQLLPWMTGRAREHVYKLMPLFSGGQRPRVQRVITKWPTRDAIEMTVIVGVGTRTRAIAARLERARHTRRGQWPHEAAPPRAPAPAGQTTPAGQAAPTGQAGRGSFQWLCTDIEAA